jgi:hypothetical protein
MEYELDQARNGLQQANANFSMSNYGNAIDSAIYSEAVSRAVMRAAWTAKVTEQTSMQLILLSAIVMVSVAVSATSTRLRRTLSGLVSDAPASVLLLAGPITYFPSLIAVAYLLGWSPSASNLAAYVDVLLVRVLAITLSAVAFSSVATLLAVRVLQRHESSEMGDLEVANRYCASIALTYLLAVLVFVILNGPGLPWYAADTNMVLMYFFLLITGITFAGLSFSSMPLIRVLSRPRAA